MSGGLMKMAKQSLVFFLKSLPENSYFNIISFGSTFESMYPVSKKAIDAVIDETVEKVEKMNANLGGTEM